MKRRNFLFGILLAPFAVAFASVFGKKEVPASGKMVLDLAKQDQSGYWYAYKFVNPRGELVYQGEELLLYSMAESYAVGDKVVFPNGEVRTISNAGTSGKRT